MEREVILAVDIGGSKYVAGLVAADYGQDLRAHFAEYFCGCRSLFSVYNGCNPLDSVLAHAGSSSFRSMISPAAEGAGDVWLGFGLPAFTLYSRPIS